jgi:hypothetical protein
MVLGQIGGSERTPALRRFFDSVGAGKEPYYCIQKYVFADLRTKLLMPMDVEELAAFLKCTYGGHDPVALAIRIRRVAIENIILDVRRLPDL